MPGGDGGREDHGVDAFEVRRIVTDGRTNPEGAQGAQATRVLRIASGDLDAAGDEDATDARHPRATEAHDVGATEIEGIGHDAPLPSATSMIQRAMTSSALRDPWALAARPMSARRGSSPMSVTTWSTSQGTVTS